MTLIELPDKMDRSQKRELEQKEIDPICFFLTSYYERPQEMDLNAFLRCFPGETLMTNDEKDVRQLRRIPMDDVDAVMQEYMGIDPKDIKKRDHVIYLEGYHSFYVYSSDFGVGHFNCRSGTIDKDEGRSLSEEDTALTLKLRDGRFFIESFVQK